jgi:hypothetical protein
MSTDGNRFVGSALTREVAHLAFDRSAVAAMAARFEIFLQDLVQHGIMKRMPVLRGEWRGKLGAFDG